MLLTNQIVRDIKLRKTEETFIEFSQKARMSTMTGTAVLRNLAGVDVYTMPVVDFHRIKAIRDLMAGGYGDFTKYAIYGFLYENGLIDRIMKLVRENASPNGRTV